MAIGKAVRAALFAMLVLLMCGPAFAASVDLHPSLCIDARPDLARQVADGAYRLQRCPGAVRTDGRVVLRLVNMSVLAALPAGWRLLLDQNRFDRIVVTAVSRGGDVQRIALDKDTIGSHWAVGNALDFPIQAAGRDVVALTVAFDRLDGPMFIRKVEAKDPVADRLRSDLWLLLIGLFVGAVISALTYNVVIYLGQRRGFQRWYVAWACSILCYAAWWTGLLGFASDLLVGPRAVRAEEICLGFVIASGAMFLMNLLEPHTLARRYVIAGRAIAAATMVAAIAAALDWIVPAVPADHWLNAILIVETVWVVATIASAARKGSKIVWFYLAGWLPVLGVFVLRLCRNLGWLPQSDAVDMATFAAMALESIILSVTISYRFRDLKRERDLAESAIAAMTIEAATLRNAAETDFLTQLGNRAAFQSALHRFEPRMALFLIDVDHLKEINDSFGHQHGDALLVHVADRLRQTGVETAMIARIGGDEFAIALADHLESDMATALDALQGAQWEHRGRSHALSLSVGHTCSGPGMREPALLYQQADFALYQAKRLGRGGRHRYDPAIVHLLDLEAGLAADARRALGNDEFLLYYQSIVDLNDRRAAGVEALLRWQHPTRGLLAPGAFASLFSDEALGPLIQEHVLRTAIDEIAAAGPEFGYMSVNFTGAQLRGKATALHILDRLKRAHVAPEKLCVEVTEGVFLDHLGHEVVDTLSVLHAGGVRIALDDFGTGYASLVHLQRFPVDILKIDRSFIAALTEEGSQAREIVRSILSLSKALCKHVVAEGIETEAQRRLLLDLGCRYGQGYLFAKPGPGLRSSGSSRTEAA